MALPPEILDRAPAEGARTVLLALLAEARTCADALASGSGPEGLHDFRVSVRRLRSTLRAWREPLGKAVRDKDLKRLRRVARATGEARDDEVLLGWLAGIAEGLPPAQRAAADWMAERVAARTSRRRLDRSAARFHDAAASLARRLGRARPPHSTGTFAAALARRIRHQSATVLACLSRVERVDDAPLAHRARIAGKRLRYLLEPLRGAACPAAGPAVKELKGLQDLLGELNDAHLAAAALREARHDRGPGIAPGGSRRPAGLRSGLRGLERLARDLARERFSRLRAEHLAAGGAAGIEPALRVAAALERHGRASGTRTRSAPGRMVQRAGRRPGCSPSTSSSTSAPSSGSASTVRAFRQRVLGRFTWRPS
jgi:CHAD domain-containing protein